MINCFKTFYYDINDTPEGVISNIRARTNLVNKLKNTNSLFEGEFSKNSFKIKFLRSGNIWIHDSFNPIFYGEVKTKNNNTRLSVKMRPNAASYFAIVIITLMWLLSLSFLFLPIEDKPQIMISSTIMLLGAFIFVYGGFRNKCDDMDYVIEDMFSGKII